jgi:hypothetical protein
MMMRGEEKEKGGEKGEGKREFGLKRNRTHVAGTCAGIGDKGGGHEVIKMQEKGGLSNWGERLAGWRWRERTERYGVFCRND